MADVPLFPSDYSRGVSKAPTLNLINKFAEANPALSTDPVAIIARPALRKFAEVGTGPVRFLYSQPGTFNDELFVVSGGDLYQVDKYGTSTLLGTLSTDLNGSVSMAATAPIGDTVPAYLFIADGGVFWVYTDNGSALGHLEASGFILNNDTISVDSVYYKWTNGSVDTGTPAGTLANPWLVKLGASNSEALLNLNYAINASGDAGTDYSTATTEHSTVQCVSYSANDLYVMAKTSGTAGNLIAVTESGTNLTWSSGSTLAGGGSPSLRQILMPEDYGAISVATINSYVIVIPIQEDAIKGRFYWVDPGETTVDPLNFATAERSPDGLHQVKVFGDQFWLFGQTTTEAWVTTGNIDAPMQRFQGILFDRGSWEGTAVLVKDALLVIDQEGGVFQIQGGQTRITKERPDIEERIRKAIQKQINEQGL